MNDDGLSLLQIQFIPTPQHRRLLAVIENRKKSIEKRGLDFGSEGISVRVRSSFSYICEEVQKEKPISEAEICTIHQLLDKKYSGKYRVRKPCESTCILNGTDNPYFPPDPEYIPSLMTQYVGRYATLDKINPLEKACAAYLLFVIIHPFDDGNGRTGRLIAARLLLQQGYEFLVPHLEYCWGNENKKHAETLKSSINNYWAWMHNPEIFNDFFKGFYLSCLRDCLAISDQILKLSQ